ncbi:MAG: succinate dehydrogenase cytochrome b subunit [Bacteriovoracaceae bacterium]
MLSRVAFYMQTSVIKKQVMAVTGLLLTGFLISHMIGNCLIFVSADAFNLYAHTLTSNPAIYLAEAILAAIFLSHIGLGISLNMQNKAARPNRYYMKQPTGQGTTFASSTMIYTGMVLLVFLIFHILHLKFGPYHETTVNGETIRDLFKTTVDYFQNPLAVAWYIFSMVCIGIHLSHGFWSAFQSLGFNHPKYNCFLKCKAKAVAVIICLGFCSMPIAMYLGFVS